MVGGKDGDPSPAAILKGKEKINPPGNLMFIIRDKKATLTWGTVSGSSFYNIYKSDQKDSGYTITASVQENKYIDSKVEQGKTYYYKIAAVDNMLSESISEVLKVEVKIEKVTKEDISKMAMNLKLDTIYLLRGDKDE